MKFSNWFLSKLGHTGIFASIMIFSACSYQAKIHLGTDDFSLMSNEESDNKSLSTSAFPSSAAPSVIDIGPESPVELGVKFRSDVNGIITGIRFYKSTANTGTHVGNLWSNTGTLLATATFTNESESGWQQVNFSSPVSITANTVYVASYFTNAGHYSLDQAFFANHGVDNPPIHLLADGVSGPNGVYSYGNTSSFPDQSWNTANYWVDVVFYRSAVSPSPSSPSSNQGSNSNSPTSTPSTNPSTSTPPPSSTNPSTPPPPPPPTTPTTTTPSTCTGKCFYVRSGATSGSGSGSDWDNAYPALPPTLIRGAVYYVAGGSYPAYTFDDPESGSLTITIKKASASNHGTDIGWHPSYGTMQAVFNSILRFNSGSYIFDGQYRDETDWYNGAKYGFKLEHNGQDQNIVIYGNSSAASNITIKHVFINAIYANLPRTTGRRAAIDTDTYTNIPGTHQNLVFSHMFVYGSNNVWLIRYTNKAIIEYSVSDSTTGDANNHGEIVNLYYNAMNAIIRHNIFSNAYLGGGGTALIAATYGGNGPQIYGNIFYNFRCGDGAIGFSTNGDMSDSLIYNNTFVKGLAASGIAAPKGKNNLIFNNIWVGNASVGVDGMHDYNLYSDSNNRGEAHGMANIPTSIFVNYNTNDFRLAAPTSPGTPLLAPFNVDMLGNVRGADNLWDRGAIEF